MGNQEGWHFSKDAGSIRQSMKPPLHKIVMYMSIFTLFGAPDIGQAGPFEDVFRSIRNSFARPAPKPHTPQPRRSNSKQSNEAPPRDASDTSNSQASPSPTPVPAPVTIATFPSIRTWSAPSCMALAGLPILTCFCVQVKRSRGSGRRDTPGIATADDA